MKRLREVLNQLYGHLDSSALQGSSNVDVSQTSILTALFFNPGYILQSVDIPGLGFGQQEYYPYVYYKINIDMVDSKV